MFLKRTTEDGLVYLTSSVLPTVHAFSTRLGGVSRNGFETFNIGSNRGDDPRAVRDNYRRWCRIFNAGMDDCCVTNQVHESYVRRVTAADRHVCMTTEPVEADGLVTAEKNLPIFCFTADCVPVLLCDQEQKAAAAVHCGWKSSVRDILANAVHEMEDSGVKPENICAALGPAIGKCCFETDRDVPEAIEHWLSGNVEGLWTVRKDGKYMVDLRLANARRLQQLGLKEENIDIAEDCTMCMHDQYWSARYTAKHGLVRGSMIAGVVLKEG